MTKIKEHFRNGFVLYKRWNQIFMGECFVHVWHAASGQVLRHDFALCESWLLLGCMPCAPVFKNITLTSYPRHQAIQTLRHCVAHAQVHLGSFHFLRRLRNLVGNVLEVSTPPRKPNLHHCAHLYLGKSLLIQEEHTWNCVRNQMHNRLQRQRIKRQKHNWSTCSKLLHCVRD